MAGVRGEVGDGLALMARVISPTYYVCLNPGTFQNRTTSGWKLLELLSLIYGHRYSSKCRATVTEGENLEFY